MQPPQTSRWVVCAVTCRTRLRRWAEVLQAAAAACRQCRCRRRSAQLRSCAACMQGDQTPPEHELVVSLADFDLSKVGGRQPLNLRLLWCRPAVPFPPASFASVLPFGLACPCSWLPQNKLRLDAFLAAKLPAASRARLQASIKGGLVVVNGRQQVWPLFGSAWPCCCAL